MPKIFYTTTWKETLVYVSFWFVLFLAPIISQYMGVQGGFLKGIVWGEVMHAWAVLAIAMSMYFVHNHFIAPLIIYNRRKASYFATSALMLIAYLLILFLARPKDDMRFRGTRPSHNRMEQYDDRHAPQPHQPPRRPAPAPFMPLLMMGPDELMALICAVLLMGMNLGVKYYFKAEKDADEMQMLERQNLEHRLQYLRYQVNPHFFMNTLNNIHALVDIDPEKAKTTIVELSKMMRYILYEGNHRLIPLQREIQFLRNYMLLMSLRYPDKVSITTDFPDTVPDIFMPPLILIIFVENAFKHGISYCNESFVKVSLQIDGTHLIFHCRNSNYRQEHGEHGGLGLVNVRKRLNLLFGNSYQLNITEGNDFYDVNLSLPLINELEKNNKKETT